MESGGTSQDGVSDDTACQAGLEPREQSPDKQGNGGRRELTGVRGTFVMHPPTVYAVREKAPRH